MVCKMVKKGVVGAALGAGTLALLFGTSAPSYVKTAFVKVRHSAKGSVPVQFEIDRARQEVADLEPAIHQNQEALARAEVDVEHIDAELVATRENLKSEERALVALRRSLDSGDFKLTGNVTYTPEEIKGELARRLDHYSRIEKNLAVQEETLKLRKQAVVAARDQLSKMNESKQILTTKIEGIETRLKQIEATQAANEFSLDDSALARAKSSVNELEKRLEVMARVAEHEGRYAGQPLPLPIEPGRDVVKEIDAKFGAPINQSGDSHADRNL